MVSTQGWKQWSCRRGRHDSAPKIHPMRLRLVRASLTPSTALPTPKSLMGRRTLHRCQDQLQPTGMCTSSQWMTVIPSSTLRSKSWVSICQNENGIACMNTAQSNAEFELGQRFTQSWLADINCTHVLDHFLDLGIVLDRQCLWLCAGCRRLPDILPLHRNEAYGSRSFPTVHVMEISRSATSLQACWLAGIRDLTRTSITFLQACIHMCGDLPRPDTDKDKCCLQKKSVPPCNVCPSA
jgi:hypothetical protein